MRFARLAIPTFLAAGAVGAALAATSAPPSLAGRWIVTLSGPVATRCLVTLTDTAGVLAGDAACPEAGVELRFGGSRQGELASGAAPGGVTWTAAREGAGLVGTYTSPRGSGAWSARAAPGGG